MACENVISVVFDCDGTLCADTTAFLLRRYGQDVTAFWEDVGSMMKEGWDPTLAFTSKICDLVRRGSLRDLSNVRLGEIGAEIEFFPGVPEVFQELRDLIQGEKRFRTARVQLEFYVITGGLEELIKGSRLFRPTKCVDDIFGCTFEGEAGGLICRPKSLVTFTEKTKFLFAISKGITGESLRENPYPVNSVVPEEEKRVPFNRMIYVGDGPSDVPCFSVIRKAKPPGVVIGVWESRVKKYPYEIVKGQRETIGPFSADYRADRGGGQPSELRRSLEAYIKSIAFDLVAEMEKSIVPPPSF